MSQNPTHVPSIPTIHFTDNQPSKTYYHLRVLIPSLLWLHVQRGTHERLFPFPLQKEATGKPL